MPEYFILDVCMKRSGLFRIIPICLSALVVLISFSGCDIAKNENKTGALIAILLMRATVGTSELVFDYNGTGNYEIYKMTTAGTNVRQLTNDSAYDNWWPRISPDRTKILFYRVPAGTPENNKYQEASLWMMNADGSGATVLRAKAADGWSIQAHAEWSPSGNEIVMCAGISGVLQIVITSPSGNVKLQVTNTGAGTWNCDPSWSPDGSTIVFNHYDSGGAEQDLDIYTIPATGGSTTRLTNQGGSPLADYDPYYSPDGTTIAWLQNVDPTGWSGAGVWAIKKMDANGSNQGDVIKDEQINSKPAWSLDGTTIYFHRMEPLVDLRWKIFKIATPFVPGSQTRVDLFTTGNSEYPCN
jgi:Tol biopolymer transport system component